MNGRRDDDWDDIFNDMYDEFGFDMKKINREIARFWESIMKGEPNSKIMGPYVYGFSYKMGPDGKPVFQEFGNVPRNGIGPKAEPQEGFREPLTDNEKSSFNKSNKMEVSSIESILHSGHKVPSVIKNGSSITYIANVRADLPNGVTSDSGSWVMVTINYFIYHAPWWLGGWTWKYGQHDVINTLYGGNKAQTVFNGLYRHDGSTAAMLTTIFAAATGIAVETLGFSELVAAISLVVSLVLSNIKNVYLEMYESTYANKPSGNKYLWSYLSIDQYDKNNPVALASSIGWYGKLASGKTVTVIPNIPGLSSPVTLSFSMWADNIASSIGTDNWFMGDAP